MTQIEMAQPHECFQQCDGWRGGRNNMRWRSRMSVLNNKPVGAAVATT
jgi:hypothetical protein